jgi:hypothetical protein
MNLPDEPTSSAPDAVRQSTSGSAGGRAERQITILGGIKRRGHWSVPARTTIISLIGGANLDLTEAEFAAPEVTITSISLLGGLHVVVPPGTNVDVTGFRVLGGRDIRVAEASAPGAPTVHLRTYSLLGGVKVRSP